MTSEGLGEMFEGDSADTCANELYRIPFSIALLCAKHSRKSTGLWTTRPKRLFPTKSQQIWQSPNQKVKEWSKPNIANTKAKIWIWCTNQKNSCGWYLWYVSTNQVLMSFPPAQDMPRLQVYSQCLQSRFSAGRVHWFGFIICQTGLFNFSIHHVFI